MNGVKHPVKDCIVVIPEYNFSKNYLIVFESLDQQTGQMLQHFQSEISILEKHSRYQMLYCIPI